MIPAAPHRGDKTRPQHGAMSIQPFSPQFMKVGDPDGRAAGAHAARRPRSRSRSGDRRLAGVRARAGRRLRPALGGAASDRDRRARRKRCSIRWPTRSICAQPFDKARARAGGGRARGVEGRHLGPRLLRQPAARRRGGAAEEARLHAARVRRGGAPRRQRGVRLRRPQPAAQHGREPDRLRAAVRPAAEGGQGARPDLSRRAVPDAGLDDRATTCTTTSRTRPAPGSRCIGSARSTASAISSAFTTIRRTRS